MPIWPIWPAGPTGLLAQPAHLARLNQLAWVWVGQTDPAQPQSPLSLTPVIPLAIWFAAAVARPFRPTPVTFVADAWTEWLPPPPLPMPPVGNRGIFPSEEIWMMFPFGIRRHHSPPIWCFAELPPLCLLCNLWCLSCTRTRRWRRRGVVLPVSARWSQPRVVSSRPRGHYPAMPSGQAPGCMVSAFSISSTFLFSALAMVSGHWSKPVSPAHRACSVMLLLNVFLLQLAVFMLCYVMIY
jgi:hypothetical protein